MKLFVEACSKFVLGFVLMGALLFLSAGTFNYFGGWLFICVLFIPMFILGVVLFLKSPQLLEKRLNSKETESSQMGIVVISAGLFVFGFVTAGLDFRYDWTKIPNVVSVIAAVILLIAYGLYAEVMRENAYLSRTIEVQENQKVISSGLYSVVRHPMYMTTIFIFLAIPIVLGSLASLVCFIPYPILISLRLKNEEKLLEERLEGYKEYKQKVKYRILPFIW